MLTFRLNGKPYQVDRQALEARVLELAEEKLADAEQSLGPTAGLVKSGVKGAVNLIFSRMNLRTPPGQDTLVFATRVLVSSLLDALEKQPIDLRAEEVAEDGR